MKKVIETNTILNVNRILTKRNINLKSSFITTDIPNLVQFFLRKYCKTVNHFDFFKLF